jgi:serine/threonine protein kinase
MILKKYITNRTLLLDFLIKLCELVNEIHSMGLVLGNINAQTIFVIEETNEPYFRFFEGLAKSLSFQDNLNTFDYSAPEVQVEYKHQKPVQMTYALDVYAVGVLYYVAVTNSSMYNVWPGDDFNLKEMYINFDSNFTEKDVELLKDTLVVKKYRIDMDTLGSKLFQRKISMVDYALTETEIWNVYNKSPSFVKEQSNGESEGGGLYEVKSRNIGKIISFIFLGFMVTVIVSVLCVVFRSRKKGKETFEEKTFHKESMETDDM